MLLHIATQWICCHRKHPADLLVTRGGHKSHVRSTKDQAAGRVVIVGSSYGKHCLVRVNPCLRSVIESEITPGLGRIKTVLPNLFSCHVGSKQVSSGRKDGDERIFITHNLNLLPSRASPKNFQLTPLRRSRMFILILTCTTPLRPYNLRMLQLG